MSTDNTIGTAGPVLVIGTGLIGTSIALALRAEGVKVLLSDPSPVALALATDMGAGEPLSASSPSPQLVVVAAPPDVSARCVVAALREHPQAIVTDVASVKGAIRAEVEAELSSAPELLRRYVGSHPMAGRERSGAGNADADLFHGRPWVIVPGETTQPGAGLIVRTLAVDLGAVPLEMSVCEHDRAVAYVSHVPQLISSLVAARLVNAPESSLDLSGQGLRDVTRVAASDPRLWTAIVSGNRRAINEVLKDLLHDLDEMINGLEVGEAPGVEPRAVGAVNKVMTAGNHGVNRIPGKHGGAPRRWAEVEVLVPDEPGELGRLFTELGAAKINIEDLSLEHSHRQKVGLARLMIDPSHAERAFEELELRGWRTVNGGERYE